MIPSTELLYIYIFDLLVGCTCLGYTLRLSNDSRQVRSRPNSQTESKVAQNQGQDPKLGIRKIARLIIIERCNENNTPWQ